MALTINIPTYNLSIPGDAEDREDRTVSVTLTKEELYAHNDMIDGFDTFGLNTPEKIIAGSQDTRDNKIQVTSLNIANYFSACLYEKNWNMERRLHKTHHYRGGEAPYYNPATLVKNKGTPVATDLGLDELLKINGNHPVPAFPKIYISDEDCNPTFLLDKNQGKRSIIIDLGANIDESTWHDKLGLDKNSAPYHASGNGLRQMQTLRWNASIYDSLRVNYSNAPNFMDSNYNNTAHSRDEIFSAIAKLLNEPEQPSTVIIKCVDGKDRSPSFAFLYAAARLYKDHKIQLNAAQFEDLKFLISVQNGPASPLEFVKKLKGLYGEDPVALLEDLYARVDLEAQNTQEQTRAVSRAPVQQPNAAPSPSPAPSLAMQSSQAQQRNQGEKIAWDDLSLEVKSYFSILHETNTIREVTSHPSPESYWNALHLHDQLKISKMDLRDIEVAINSLLDESLDQKPAPQPGSVSQPSTFFNAPHAHVQTTEEKKFFEVYKKIKSRLSRHTRITQNSTLMDMLTNALGSHKSTSFKVFVKLKWLNKDGTMNESTPGAVRDIYERANIGNRPGRVKK